MSLDMCFFFPPGYAFDSVPYVFDTTNLVAYWKLSDASDAFGANTLTNDSITFGAGKLGNCATPAGSGSLNIADNAALSMDTNQAFTIDGWMQHAAAGNNDMLVAKGSGGSAGAYEYVVRVNASDLMTFDVSNGTTDKNLSASGFGALAINTWYYFCAWHDPVNDVLGLRVNATEVTTAWADGCRNSAETLYLCARGDGFQQSGKLDDVSIWKRVLSSDERAARYNGGNGREIL